MPQRYSVMVREAQMNGLEIIETTLRGRNRGFYGDGLIVLDDRIDLLVDKACILAEEIGHYHTSAGDILDQSVTDNRKQERRAREWAYERLVPLSGIVEAYYAGIAGRHDLAEFLEVPEQFLEAAIERYRDKHGQYFAIDRYVIYFNPLAVAKLY